MGRRGMGGGDWGCREACDRDCMMLLGWNLSSLVDEGWAILHISDFGGLLAQGGQDHRTTYWTRTGVMIGCLYVDM